MMTPQYQLHPSLKFLHYCIPSVVCCVCCCFCWFLYVSILVLWLWRPLFPCTTCQTSIVVVVVICFCILVYNILVLRLWGFYIISPSAKHGLHAMHGKCLNYLHFNGAQLFLNMQVVQNVSDIEDIYPFSYYAVDSVLVLAQAINDTLAGWSNNSTDWSFCETENAMKKASISRCFVRQKLLNINIQGLTVGLFKARWAYKVSLVGIMFEFF